MNTSSGDQTSPCAIIAGYLKFKVLRIKGGKDAGPSSSPSTQDPKAGKQYWFEFRVPNSTTKVVEYYDKGQEKAKGVILLDLVVSVQLLVPHKKQQFMMECSDGQARIFETLTIEETYAWVTALNAVLFGKNMRGESRLEYSVALQPSTFLDYCGPCILVINETEIAVYGKDLSEDHVIVRWKLHHLRSFRAKKDSFVVRTGSRTTTGSGEFYFSTKEDESVLMTYAVEAVLTRLKAKLTITNTSINAESHKDSASRRSMLLLSPSNAPDNLGILSPPMDLTQAPGHLDPGMEEQRSPSSRGPAYQGEIDPRPQGGNQQEFGWATVSTPSSLLTHVQVESPAILSRSMTNKGVVLPRRHVYDEADLDLRPQAGTTPEHRTAPPPPISSLYSVLGEEEAEPPALPPYDRLNRGVVTCILSATVGGYSKIRWEEEGATPPSVVHKNFRSNPDLVVSQTQDQTAKNVALYDTVYESSRSNSSGSITIHRSSRNRSPPDLVVSQTQDQTAKNAALYDTVYESSRSNSSGSITIHSSSRNRSPPDLVVSQTQDQTAKNAALYDTVYESSRSNSSGSITIHRSSRNHSSKCDVAVGEESNESYSVFGQFSSHQLKAVTPWGVDGSKMGSIAAESSRRLVYGSPAVNDGAAGEGDADTPYINMVDQVSEDRPPLYPPRDRNVSEDRPPFNPPRDRNLSEDQPPLYPPRDRNVSEDRPPFNPPRDRNLSEDQPPLYPPRDRNVSEDRPPFNPPRDRNLSEDQPPQDRTRNKIPKPPSAPPEGGDIWCMTVSNGDPPAPPNISHKKPLAPKPFPSDKPCAVKPLITVLKEGSSDKATSFSNKQKLPEALDAMYTLLTDEPDSQNNPNQKSAVSPTDGRLVVAKTERNTATSQRGEGKEGSSTSDKPDTEPLLAEIRNITYGMLIDDSHKSTKPSPDGRQAIVAKSERSLNGPQKDRARDKSALPKGVEVQVQADAMYALLTDEDNMAERPATLTQQDTSPKRKTKRLPKPPVAPKPHILPKPSVLAQGQSSTATQQTASPKPPVIKRVKAKALTNHYEGNPPAPKPRAKVVPS